MPDPKSKAAPEPPPTRTVEEWATAKGSPAWAYRAAFVAHHWCHGLSMTESDYDAALHAAQHGEIR